MKENSFPKKLSAKAEVAENSVLEALRQSEEKYRTLFNSIDQGLTLCQIIRNQEGQAIDFIMLEVNPTYEEQTGVNKETVLGKKIIETFPSLTKWLATYAAVVDNQCPVVFEHYFEETQRWFAIKAYPVEKEKFAVLFSNITERKQTEEQLKENNLIFKSIPDAIISSDITGKVTSWNKCAEALYGFTKEEMIGQKMPEMVPTEILNKEQTNWQEIFAQQGHWKGEVIQTCKDGKKIYVLAAAHVIRNIHGEITGYVSVNRDITTQKEADIKTKESENRFRTMADASPILIWTIDAKGLSSYYNKTFLDFIGVAKEEDISDWSKIVHPDDVQSTLDIITTAITKHHSYSLECRLLRADGQWRWVLAQGNASMGAKKEFLGFVGSSVDITERKLYENKVIEAKTSAENTVKFKQQFLSNMSHEIRTPLNSILGFTNVLLKTPLVLNQKEFVQAIKTSSKSLKLLIDDILDLAKVDAGKMIFEKQPFEIRASLKALLYSFDLKVKEKNLELIKEYDLNIPLVLLGDSVRLNQIILNLISNSVKFTHTGKIVLIVKLLNQDEQNVTLQFTLTDTGIGISPDKIKSIFNLFEQADLTTSKSYGGTGLGLAIVKQLIESQGGTISVVSKLGVGSTFTFTLPFEKSTIKSEQETEIFQLDSEIKNLQILVAEDVALNQLLIKIILSDFGFQYEIVDNGKLAVEKLQINTYDIILMDLQMPEMNGFEATQYIRQTLKSQIPIIALTADVTTADVTKCKEFGMNDYVSKPIDEKQLYNKILELVDKKK